MKVRFNFGPNADKVVHLPNNPVTDIMIQAGVLTAVDERPESRPVSTTLQPLTSPRFNVGQNPRTGDFFIRATDGRSELFFVGDPADASTFKFSVCGGCVAPPEIVQQYRRCKDGQKNPEWLADKALNDRADLEARMNAQAKGVRNV